MGQTLIARRGSGGDPKTIEVVSSGIIFDTSSSWITQAQLLIRLEDIPQGVISFGYLYHVNSYQDSAYLGLIVRNGDRFAGAAKHFGTDRNSPSANVFSTSVDPGCVISGSYLRIRVGVAYSQQTGIELTDAWCRKIG